MELVTVVEGQTLFDIAVQAAGSITAAFEIAAANDISITDDLSAGTVLKIPRVVDQVIRDYYRAKKVIPKTGLRKQDMDAAPYGGIEYMAIEIDFIVS